MDRAELENYLQDRPHRLAEHLEGEEVHRREAVERAIILLHRERWTLYMRLVTPYFCNDPRPELVEVWRAEAGESVARRMALADHEDALRGLRVIPYRTTESFDFREFVRQLPKVVYFRDAALTAPSV